MLLQKKHNVYVCVFKFNCKKRKLCCFGKSFIQQTQVIMIILFGSRRVGWLVGCWLGLTWERQELILINEQQEKTRYIVY